VQTISGRDTKHNLNANGFRLPTEGEWEYPTIGDEKSRNYQYSGSNVCEEIA